MADAAVTLLGDAAHPMPPVGGLGGSTALRDAHLLSRRLAMATSGGEGLRAAVAGYEEEMRSYGFAAVAQAMAMKDRQMGVGAVRTALARAFFRLCVAVPAARRLTFLRAWSAQATPRAWEVGPLPAMAERG